MQRISLVSLGNRGTNHKLSKECFLLRASAKHIFLHRIFMEICSSSLCTDLSFPQGEGGLNIGYANENWSETDGIDYVSEVFTLVKFNTSCCTCHESCERARPLPSEGTRRIFQQLCRKKDCDVRKEMTDKFNTADFGNQFLSAASDDSKIAFENSMSIKNFSNHVFNAHAKWQLIIFYESALGFWPSQF